MTKDDRAIMGYMQHIANGTKYIEVATPFRDVRGTPGEYDSYGFVLHNAYHAVTKHSLGDLFIPWVSVEWIRMVRPPYEGLEAWQEHQPTFPRRTGA
jgi:hypothetical protein